MTWIAARSHWVGAFGLIAFLASFGILETQSWASLNKTPADIAQTTAMLQGMGRASSYLLPTPEHVEMLRGYIQWFLIGWIPAFFSAWAAIAGGGAGRGDEEKGLVEQWLSWGVRRMRYVAARAAGFALAVLVAVVGVDVIVLAADAAGSHDLQPLPVFLQSVAQAATSLPVFAFALVASQIFINRRAASAATGLVVGMLYLVNGFSRSVSWLQPFRWLSPYTYADRSDAMVPDGHFDVAATGVLLGATVVLTAIAALLMVRRDLYAALISTRRDSPVQHHAASESITTLPVLWRVWDQRVGLSVWGLAIAAYALSTVPLARAFVDSLTASSGNREMARVAMGIGASSDPYADFVSTVWFRAACLLMAIYAVTQVARWASEDTDGRLEWMLSLGRARWEVAFERVFAVAAGLAVIAAGDVVGVLIGGATTNLNLDTGSVMLAAAMTIPVGLAFAGAGAAIAAWKPRVSVAAAIGVLGVSYMVPFAAVPIFKTPPDWFLDLSAFQLYGSPLVEGIDTAGITILVAAAAAGFGVALLALLRRDVST